MVPAIVADVKAALMGEGKRMLVQLCATLGEADATFDEFFFSVEVKEWSTPLMVNGPEVSGVSTPGLPFVFVNSEQGGRTPDACRLEKVCATVHELTHTIIRYWLARRCGKCRAAFGVISARLNPDVFFIMIDGAKWLLESGRWMEGRLGWQVPHTANVISPFSLRLKIGRI
jgi:hypothetical protein